MESLSPTYLQDIGCFDHITEYFPIQHLFLVSEACHEILGAISLTLAHLLPLDHGSFMMSDAIIF
jgi:hypothetical protein